MVVIMSSNVIDFPFPDDIIGDKKCKEILGEINKNFSLGTCKFCGKTYVYEDNTYGYCNLSQCFIKGVLSAIASADIKIEQQKDSE